MLEKAVTIIPVVAEDPRRIMAIINVDANMTNMCLNQKEMREQFDETHCSTEKKKRFISCLPTRNQRRTIGDHVQPERL